MAHFEKATSVHDWLNQRLAIDKVEKVMASEYWIPKNINFLWAMGNMALRHHALCYQVPHGYMCL